MCSLKVQAEASTSFSPSTVDADQRNRCNRAMARIEVIMGDR
jgi:hypothetical protein